MRLSHPVNVLHVISSLTPAYGGPAIALAGLVEAQRRAGLNVTVLSTWREGDDPQVVSTVRDCGAEVVLVGPALGPLQRCDGLTSAVHSAVGISDIVHMHGVWEELQYQCSKSALRHGCPYIIRPCGMLDPWSLSQGRLKKKLYLQWRLKQMLKRSSAIHFTTSAEQRLAAPLCSSTDAIIEPNGLAPELYQNLPSRSLFRNKYGIGSDEFVFLFLSRIHPKKGLDVLLSAFSQISIPKVRLVVVGGGCPDHVQRFESSVRRSGISSRVTTTGMLTGRDKLEAYSSADGLVLPSHQENFGNVVIEAAACGLPVLISEHVNLSDSVIQANVGEVVPLSDGDLRAAMQRWVQDRAKVVAYRRNCPTYTRQFHWGEIAERWQRHYQRLTGQSLSTVPLAFASSVPSAAEETRKRAA